MILLDIVMDGVDGMELARTIRQIDETVAIVFITSHEKYALQGYDVKALHFLMKPPDPQLLENLIKSVYTEISRVNSQVNFLTIKSGDHRIRVPIKDIVSMEISKRRVEVSLIDGIVYYSGKLTDLLDELPKGFFIRCHQAFAINIANIKELNRRNAIAINGKEIPVSRTFWNDTKAAFLKQLS
jgi:DNA-binding LytR/AlgR family response regulator